MSVAWVLSHPELQQLQTMCVTHGERKPAGEKYCWKCIERECYKTSVHWGVNWEYSVRTVARTNNTTSKVIV